MLLRGQLIAETPLFRGNARKTLFTRDRDGTERLVSLAGEISGTAQSLMDAFIGQSRDGKNIGLLDRLWRRLYGGRMPEGLIQQVECRLQSASYPRDHFFDLRMGLKLDEDRWAADANANYKMETVFKNAAFDFTVKVNDRLLDTEDHAARLYYVLQELRAGRFWFGAGKSKGLGRVRLEMEDPFPVPDPPAVRPQANHLRIGLTFNAMNPVLVGWNWGKVDPAVPAFAAVEGRLLVGAMRELPDPLGERLEMVLGGPILSADDWKGKFAQHLPRAIALWLQERARGEVETWTLAPKALAKLGRGKYKLSKNVMAALEPLCEQSFPSREAASTALEEAMADKPNMANRVLKVMDKKTEEGQQFDPAAWEEVAQPMGLSDDRSETVAAQIHDEAALTETVRELCEPVLPRLYLQVDQQIKLLQSDAWVDAEIATREAHLQIKTLLREGKISEEQWELGDPTPEGVSPQVWDSFLDEHRRVRHRHMVHPGNLGKSITNDRNFIAFLQAHRSRTRQELGQPHHLDFRFGGPFNREISRNHGKPYDNLFMRMLSWSPSSQEEGTWEVYVPGGTLKGAFRKRASQVLKTLWGESPRTQALLDHLFGVQGRVGAVFFSDAYLKDGHNPDQAWCSMDGVRMDPATGQPVESAKRDYLFAYGDQLVFELQLDVQDIREEDLGALSLLAHLIQDFQQGDIPIGGEKTSGFGWVRGQVEEITWRTGDPHGLTATLFAERSLTREGIWHCLSLEGEEAAGGLRFRSPLEAERAADNPPRATGGFISHRAFGGYCGTLVVEAEVLTPLHVRESGEPSGQVLLEEAPVYGWDFFSMAPPEAERRSADRAYALPSRSLKGMVRHLYAIAGDSREPSDHLDALNPVDSLFGWVGSGPNQAIMGRVSFGFGRFEAPERGWFKVPYPYTGWLYRGEWSHQEGQAAPRHQIARTWRCFLHTPLAPIVQRLEAFQPDSAQASYFQAILPGGKARFTLRFWNLEEAELQRLIWCVALEPSLAHKMGHHRYLGLGSLCLRLLPESFLIDWGQRYAGGSERDWQQPIRLEDWLNPRVIAHYDELRKALHAGSL